MAVVIELMQKIENDEVFRDSLLKSSDEKEFFGKLTEAGFDVTPNEILEAINYSKNGEISDDELESVAGGVSWDYFIEGVRQFFLWDDATWL